MERGNADAVGKYGCTGCCWSATGTHRSREDQPPRFGDHNLRQHTIKWERQEDDSYERSVRESELARMDSPNDRGDQLPMPAKVEKKNFKPWETHPARWATKTSKKTGRTSSGRRGMDLADSQRGEQSSWDYQQTDRVYGNVDHHREDSTRRSPQIDPVGRWKASPSERRSIGGTRDGSSCV